MVRSPELLYPSQNPTATPVLRRRHCYESILISSLTADHQRWMRALQQRLRRHRGPRGDRLGSYPAWPRRYRLGEIQRYGNDEDVYTTAQALALLMHNRTEPVGFCSFAVGGGPVHSGCREIQVVVDAVWIVESERDQWQSRLLCAAVAEGAFRLVRLLQQPEQAHEVAFELSMPPITQAGYGFLVGCTSALELQHGAEGEVFVLRSSIYHSDGELDRIDCLSLTEDVLA